jgi:hypothetical protein
MSLQMPTPTKRRTENRWWLPSVGAMSEIATRAAKEHVAAHDRMGFTQPWGEVLPLLQASSGFVTQSWLSSGE